MQQGGLEGGDVVMAEVGDGEKVEGGEGTGGIRCLKCTKKGHIAAKCTKEIYCVICDSHDHVNHKCPVLKMPRPVAHAVGYTVHGLGFHHIPRPPLAKAKRESRMALISVEGGQLFKEGVILQLERLFPGKWVWDLKDHEENSFLTKFPSKVELQQAIAFGGADIKGVGAPEGAHIKFEMWKEKEARFLLPKVWVRIGGLRKELREFLELWAIGSLLGSTQMVDMETTRKNDFGRVLVAVLNPTLIPSNLDVVIGDHYFELEFEVEKMGFDVNGEEAAIEWSGGGSKEGDGELEGAELEDGREAERQKMEIRQEEGSKGDRADISNITKLSLKEQVQNMDEEQFEAFLRKKAGEL
jgi:hypothetical protein